MNKALLKVYKEFKKEGLLLLSDNSLPSLTAVIAGEPIKGSWWGHPLGNLMYNISNQLEDDPEVLVIKLINKKVCYLDKKHWPALLVAQGEADWQLKKLSTDSLKLFKKVQTKGQIRADDRSFKKLQQKLASWPANLKKSCLFIRKVFTVIQGSTFGY